MLPDKIWDRLVWLLLLFPGFLSLTILSLVYGVSALSEFQIVFYSFVLTCIVILISIPFYTVLVFAISIWRNLDGNGRGAQVLFYSVIVVISIALGSLLGIAAEKDVFFVTLRSLPVTEALNKRSSSRPLVFLLSQNTSGQLDKAGDARRVGKQTEAWIRVVLKSGAIFEGWPEFYEVGAKPSEIYLSPACSSKVVDGKLRAERIDGPGVIILEASITHIILLDRESSECFDLWLGTRAPESSQ